jgi:hypothetical protein
MSYKCNCCNKLYKSYQTWWVHNKKYHKNRDVQSGSHDVVIGSHKCSHNVVIENFHNNETMISNNTVLTNSIIPHDKKTIVFLGISEDVSSTNMINDAEVSNILQNKCKAGTVETIDRQDDNVLICKYCYTGFQNRSNRWRHEKTCKNKTGYRGLPTDVPSSGIPRNMDKESIRKEKELELQIKKEEAKIKREEIMLKKEEAKILKLQLKLQNSNKAEPRTLNMLNKLLSKHNNRFNNSNINSNNNNTINNIQNNITNNFHIVGFGKEDGIPTILSDNEKRMILGYRLLSLKKLIETVHCGKYNQFKNIIITNMKDNYIYSYDDTKGVFVLASKDDVINNLINYRLVDLDTIFNEFVEQNRIGGKTKECIEEFMNRMNYGDDTDKKSQIDEIKMLLFNNKDKITNDIFLMLKDDASQEYESITENI